MKASFFWHLGDLFPLRVWTSSSVNFSWNFAGKFCGKFGGNFAGFFRTQQIEAQTFRGKNFGAFFVTNVVNQLFFGCFGCFSGCFSAVLPWPAQFRLFFGCFQYRASGTSVGGHRDCNRSSKKIFRASFVLQTCHPKILGPKGSQCFQSASNFRADWNTPYLGRTQF